MANKAHIECQVTKQMIAIGEAVPVATIRPGLVALIKKQCPTLSTEGYVSKEVVDKFRAQYIEIVLKKDRGELSKLDRQVIKSMTEHEILSKDVEAHFEGKQTFGEKVSDKLAEFGGSWTFLGIFAVILAVWVSVNSMLVFGKPFDPYPYILLNLILSCIAAIQAPVIMMSQNRKEAKDRLRAENDYKINLKAELEIRHLHEKLDNLTQHQWQRLLEIQQMQLDLMEEKNNQTSSPRRQKRTNR